MNKRYPPGTWASCPRCSSSMLSIHVVAGGTPTSLVAACEAPAGLDRGSQPYSNAVGIAKWLVESRCKESMPLGMRHHNQHRKLCLSESYRVPKGTLALHHLIPAISQYLRHGCMAGYPYLMPLASAAQWVARVVGVSPAITIREAQQRNMPPGIAGEMPTSLAFLMVVVGFGCCAGLLELCSVSVSWCGCKGMLINPNRVLRKVREIVFFIRIRKIVSLISLKFSKFACEYAKIVSRTL